MRNYISIGAKGTVATVFGLRRDTTGEPLVLLDQDEIKKLRLDLINWLGSDTISSATVTAENVTCSASLASPYYDLTLSASSASDGKVTILITTSTSEVMSLIIRVRRPMRHTAETRLLDYA